MLAGTAPIRALKARYYADARLMARILPPPSTIPLDQAARPVNDWTGLDPIAAPQEPAAPESPVAPAEATRLTEAKPPAESHSGLAEEGEDDAANAGIRREPELGEHEEIVPVPKLHQNEFDFDLEEDADGDAARNRQQADRMRRIARNASLDPDDGIAL